MEHTRWSISMLLLTLAALFVIVIADDTNSKQIEETKRKAKLFPVFQVIQFENDPCPGSSRNGTCYTNAECTAKGGTASGTCAQGYGVCCIFTLACGGTSSQNCTYLVQASTTKAPATTCSYTLCKCSSNICRIRLDFTSFQIVGPQVGTTVAGAAAVGNGGGVGDCVTDSFSITSPGSTGSPVICGFNTGQHMIVDASDSCSVANFDIGSTSDTRQWDIKVTQYACGDDQGGPDGCLQYFTGSNGRISSYNFPTTSNAIGAATTHLSSQCYTICIRQEVGKCSICYIPSIVVDAAAAAPAAIQNSFGLSNQQAAAAIGTTNTNTGCTSDYLVIPNALTAFVAGALGTNNNVDRICGRIFTANTIAAAAGVTASVCSNTDPFRITFKTDANEVTTGAANPQDDTNEQSIAPGGIVGFSLNYVQQSC